MAELPVDVDSTAALFVDVQNDYVHEEGELPQKIGYDVTPLQNRAEHMVEFLETWRELGNQVIHVRTHQSGMTNSPLFTHRYSDEDRTIVCQPGTWGAEFYDGLEPMPDEPVITKHRYSGFVGTNLEVILRSNGIETLVMAGVVSHVCVEATARDGFHNDYHIVVVEDCTGPTDESIHEAAMKNLDLFYGDVVTSDELIDQYR